MDRGRNTASVCPHASNARIGGPHAPWSIARDVADPELWTERYRCPTWFDYLRQRNRATRINLKRPYRDEIGD
jgi:hypothetical protein